MWICTQHGYYSAVADRDEPESDMLWVRARAYDDLWTIREMGYETGPIIGMERADYPYRVNMKRSEWARYLTEEIGYMDYPNFKKRVASEQGHKRADIYMDVWHDMTRIESVHDPMRKNINQNNQMEKEFPIKEVQV